MKRIGITVFNLHRNLEKQFAEDEEILEDNFTSTQIEYIKENVNLAKYARHADYAYIFAVKTFLDKRCRVQIAFAKKRKAND